MKREAVMKRVNTIAARRAEIISEGRPQDIRPCLPLGNAKVRTLNFALAPVLDCNNCAGCCGLCYDICHACHRPSVVDARARMSALYHLDKNLFFSRIADRIDKTGAVWLRALESGDAPDIDFFEGLTDLHRSRPSCRIWTYTKNFDALDAFERDHGGRPFREICPGVTILRSKVPGCRFSNPYGDPEAAIRLKGAPAPDGHRCPGSGCGGSCMLCPYGKNVYFDEH